MKSDREFLDGIYKKSEDIKKDKSFELVDGIKINPYRKYMALAATLLLLITSILYIESGLNLSMGDKKVEENIPNTIKQVQAPAPRTLMMISYTENLLVEASDIVGILGFEDEDKIEIEIIESYKGSFDRLEIIEYIREINISLEKDEHAIVFIQNHLENIEIMDVFLYSNETKNYVNEYGEMISPEQLIGIK